MNNINKKILIYKILKLISKYKFNNSEKIMINRLIRKLKIKLD